VNTTEMSVCACDDQMGLAGAACGLVNGQPAACSPGLSCMVDGYCHVNCDVAAPECPIGQTCQPTLSVCSNGPILPANGNDGGVVHLGNAGCGCGTSGDTAAALLALFGAATLRRRARRTVPLAPGT
jgi:MYXO-CTERM domain-containing protein